jgi:excisionase family DNA binding protein
MNTLAYSIAQACTVACTGRGAPRRHLREQVKFLAIHEVAEQLNVSTRTVRRWIELGNRSAPLWPGRADIRA